MKTKNNELYSKCIQLKLVSTDGKKYATDCFSQEDIIEVVKTIPSKRAIQTTKGFVKFKM